MNEPRCDMGRPRCRNQAAGFWRINDSGKRIALCDDDRQDIEDQGITLIPGEWEPLHPDPVRVATADRLARMAAGYFG